ncbi:MAG: hypothetical protein IT165_06540 [Bryobacterales bacterium]|nr:hypothetical protein [Bryobacterales bacterium]
MEKRKYLVRFDLDGEVDGFVVMADDPAQAEELVWQDLGKNYDPASQDDMPVEIHEVEEVTGPVYRVMTEVKLAGNKEGFRASHVVVASAQDDAKQKAFAACVGYAAGFDHMEASILEVEEVQAINE